MQAEPDRLVLQRRRSCSADAHRLYCRGIQAHVAEAHRLSLKKRLGFPIAEAHGFIHLDGFADGDDCMQAPRGICCTAELCVAGAGPGRGGQGRSKAKTETTDSELKWERQREHRYAHAHAFETCCSRAGRVRCSRHPFCLSKSRRLPLRKVPPAALLGAAQSSPYGAT